MSDDARSIPKRMPADWLPPVPAWSALSPHEGSLRIAYYGVQTPDGVGSPAVSEFRAWFMTLLKQECAPAHCEYAEFKDLRGHYTWMVIAYWLQADDYHRWSSSVVHQGYWLAPQRLQGVAGVFREVLLVPSERFETLQSSVDERAGAAKVCPVLHGPIREHNYWGGMRDRLVASAEDPLPGAATAPQIDAPAGAARGRRLRVNAPVNLAVIRSGQAFGELQGEERVLYGERIEPALCDGMAFLAARGRDVGCLSCRLLRETDAKGKALPRSFGLAHFVSLQHLEDWAHSHPTHLRIYNEFLSMSKALGDRLQLRLWHEVAVLPAQDQLFEYLNCHFGTGLLAQAVYLQPQETGVHL